MLGIWRWTHTLHQLHISRAKAKPNVILWVCTKKKKKMKWEEPFQKRVISSAVWRKRCVTGRENIKFKGGQGMLDQRAWWIIFTSCVMLYMLFIFCASYLLYKLALRVSALKVVVIIKIVNICKLLWIAPITLKALWSVCAMKEFRNATQDILFWYANYFKLSILGEW